MMNDEEAASRARNMQDRDETRTEGRKRSWWWLLPVLLFGSFLVAWAVFLAVASRNLPPSVPRATSSP